MGEPIGSRVEPDRGERSEGKASPAEEVPRDALATGDDDGRPIGLAVPARRGLDAAILLSLLLPSAGLQFPVAYVWLHEFLTRTLELPRPLPTLGVAGAVVGSWLLLLGLLFVRAARYSGVHIDPDGLVVGTLGPPPRGTRHRWRDLAGFAVTSTGVLVEPLRRSWFAPGRPVLPCEGATLHRIVTRLEAHGVPRLDG